MPASNLDPQKVLQYSFGYAPPLIIEAAVRLNLFDALADGEKSSDDLAAATGTNIRGVRILLNGLVGLGLLTHPRPGHYALTPESAAFLVRGRPAYMGGFFHHTSEHLLPKWLRLTEIVRSGKPSAAVNAEGDGAAFFQKFVEDIFPLSRQAALGLAEHLKLSEMKSPVSVLDLASGSGVWGVSLAEKGPTVRVTAVDWPGVIPVTRRVAERHGLGSRFTYVAGDLSDADFGGNHSVATLGHILHSEGIERSRVLLKKTFAALAPGGTIAIAEWLVNEDRSGPPPGLIFAVNMLVNTERGDTFSFAEIARWLTSAGFENPHMLEHLPCPSPLIFATKPG
ncbi:MAG TPA: methyltransferase [Gemmata sp.]|nr:methyltransferase [Gemmata sp.]